MISEYIARSTLRPGDRLPSEHDVMSALGVGRSTVREAMRHLQALGVVETRRGSGSFLLKSVSAATLHLPLSVSPASAPAALRQMLDVRRALEVEASILAALRAEDADIERLGRSLEAIERAPPESGADTGAETAFRRAVHAATRNPLFSQMLEPMDAAFDRLLEGRVDRADIARRTLPFHRALFEAIGRGDALAAREAALRLLAICEEAVADAPH